MGLGVALLVPGSLKNSELEGPLPGATRSHYSVNISGLFAHGGYRI
jgi:hypothetical protein